MTILVRVLITALGLLIAAYVVPGIAIANLYIAIIAAIILGLLNLIVRPVLVVLTLPITILTLGLFMFVINAALFLFVASFVDGFAVQGFLAALIGSLIVSVVSAIGNKLV
ncbi:MAG: phage holin family protein [Candidatus Pacebacteria bacterium]|nr:phage holin family protein [Candidatus Paceibacterota bacterium]